MSAAAPHPSKFQLRSIFDRPFFLAAFLSMLFVGGDVLAIGGAGSNIRAVTFSLGFLLILLLLNPKDFAFDRTTTILFSAFAGAGILSMVGSYDLNASIGYTAWIGFTFVGIVTVGYNIARRVSPSELIQIWMLVFRIQVALLAIEVPIRVGLHAAFRPHLWFYEPSFAAIYLGGYFSSALYLFARGDKTYRNDVLISTAGLVLVASATAMFAIAFGVLFAIVTTKARWRILGVASAIMAFGGIIGTVWFSKTPYFGLTIGFIERIFSNSQGSVLTNAWTVLAARAGNRLLRAIFGLHAFKQHPIFGIGIGADRTYMAPQNLDPEILYYARTSTAKDINTEGMPFTNIFIDVLGSMGIVGFTIFMAIIGYAIYIFVKTKSLQAKACFVAFFTMIVALQADGNFLRYYLWLPFGLAVGIHFMDLRLTEKKQQAREETP